MPTAMIYQMLMQELRKRGVPEDMIEQAINSPEGKALAARIPTPPTIGPAPPPGPMMMGGPNAKIGPAPPGPLANAPVGRGAALGEPQPFAPNAPVQRGPIGPPTLSMGQGGLSTPPTPSGLLGGPNAKIGPAPSGGFGMSQRVAGGSLPDLPPKPDLPMDAPFQPVPASYAGGSAITPPKPVSLPSRPAPVTPSPGMAQPAMKPSGSELPYQTYERVTGDKWTGGGSDKVREMLQQLGITGDAGAADTNTALQKALLNRQPTNVEGPMMDTSTMGERLPNDVQAPPLPSRNFGQSLLGPAAPQADNALPSAPRRKFLGIF